MGWLFYPESQQLSLLSMSALLKCGLVSDLLDEGDVACSGSDGM